MAQKYGVKRSLAATDRGQNPMGTDGGVLLVERAVGYQIENRGVEELAKQNETDGQNFNQFQIQG